VARPQPRPSSPFPAARAESNPEKAIRLFLSHPPIVFASSMADHQFSSSEINADDVGFSLCGKDLLMKAYREGIDRKYRFYSYAMRW